MENKLIFMLPGPPAECRPMFDHYILPYLKNNDYSSLQKTKTIKLIGVIEADIAGEIEKINKNPHLVIAYCWNDPYLDIKVSYEKKDAVSAIELIKKIRGLNNDDENTITEI